MNEDCLTLNVFMPQNAKPGDDLAVMIFIHGGGFVSGSGADYDGSLLAATTNVIVVTFNYRLGPLGFMNFHDPVLCGNYGLKDQIEAIKWVKENVASFGGDMNRITVFGSGDGARATRYLAGSKANKHMMIKRVILQSEPFHYPLSTDEHRKHVVAAGDLLGCTWNKSATIPTQAKDLLGCFKGKPAKTIADITNAPSFQPAEDDYDFLLPSLMIDLRDPASMSAKRFGSVDVIVGSNSNEYASKSLVSAFLNDIGASNGLSDAQFMATVTQTMAKIMGSREFSKIEAVQLIKNLYNSDEPTERLKKVVSMMTDKLFTSQASILTDLHNSLPGNGNTFQYVFDYRGAKSAAIDWATNGAACGDELLYLFGSNDKNDNDMMRTMMKYWSNFAKSGNPNSPHNVPQWDATTAEQPKYLLIGATGDMVDGIPRKTYVKTWSKLMGHDLSMSGEMKMQRHDCRKSSISRLIWIRADEAEAILIGLSVALAVFIIIAVLLAMFLSSARKKLRLTSERYQLLSKHKPAVEDDDFAATTGAYNFQNATLDMTENQDNTLTHF
ncbi:neuroligin-4, Y-linked-like [Tubulanus polymorphus]|uniref:neuroligin-4, Y-linked-like n=1 Tax=Tubulanus polymorphus TaxID=672921 RepID=UPI003DA62250